MVSFEDITEVPAAVHVASKTRQPTTRTAVGTEGRKHGDAEGKADAGASLQKMEELLAAVNAEGDGRAEDTEPGSLEHDGEKDDAKCTGLKTARHSQRRRIALQRTSKTKVVLDEDERAEFDSITYVYRPPDAPLTVLFGGTCPPAPTQLPKARDDAEGMPVVIMPYVD